MTHVGHVATKVPPRGRGSTPSEVGSIQPTPKPGCNRQQEGLQYYVFRMRGSTPRLGIDPNHTILCKGSPTSKIGIIKVQYTSFLGTWNLWEFMVNVTSPVSLWSKEALRIKILGQGETPPQNLTVTGVPKKTTIGRRCISPTSKWWFSSDRHVSFLGEYISRNIWTMKVRKDSKKTTEQATVVFPRHQTTWASKKKKHLTFHWILVG